MLLVKTGYFYKKKKINEIWKEKQWKYSEHYGPVIVSAPVKTLCPASTSIVYLKQSKYVSVEDYWSGKALYISTSPFAIDFSASVFAILAT